MMHRYRPDRSWSIINFDHHPIVHTLLLQGMLWLGTQLFGSMNAGMALYTALQMLLLAGSMSYGVLVLHRRQVAAGWQIVMMLLGMFFPFHWYMSVSMTKDTVFSAFLLLQLISTDGSVAGEPQGMASRSPGSAVFYRNSGNDTVSQ